MKKFLCLIVSIIWMWIWFVGAQSISLEPQWNWVFWYDCMVPIDVYMDTNWYEISAIDLMIESSMEYKDFVPSDLIPYFFKPIIRDNGLVHIVWFTVDPSERINWEWKIWTVYFLPNEWDSDWIVRLYFLWEWETTDTNLWIAWWIDVLKEVWQASVRFLTDLPSCAVKNSDNISNDKIEAVEVQITWWFETLTYEEVLDNTIKTIDVKYSSHSFWDCLTGRMWVFVISILILLIIILLLLKKVKNKWNKNKMNW